MTLLILIPKVCLADTLSDKDGLEVMKNLTALQYWSKGPFSLLQYCNSKYPTVNNVANDSYSKWNKKNLDYNTKVDNLNNYFSPLMAIKTDRTEDEWNLHLTKMVVRIVGKQIDKDIDVGQIQYLCSEGFTEFLDGMFSEELIKPHVAIAAEKLEKFKRTKQW